MNNLRTWKLIEYLILSLKNQIKEKSLSLMLTKKRSKKKWRNTNWCKPHVLLPSLLRQLKMINLLKLSLPQFLTQTKMSQITNHHKAKMIKNKTKTIKLKLLSTRKNQILNINLSQKSKIHRYKNRKIKNKIK